MSPSDDIPPEVRALAETMAMECGHPWLAPVFWRAIMTDRAARTPDAGVLRAVDTQVLTAAGEMDVQEQAQPAWLWHERENGSISYGRWSKAEAAAPYIRADLVLAALTSPAPITKTAIAEHGEDDAGVAGMVLVPREPTRTMMDAGLYHASADASWADIYTVWTNMVDTFARDGAEPAAPSQEQPNGK